MAAAAFCTAMFAPLNLNAEDPDETVRRKAVAILLKVLSYDKNLEKRSADGLRIGVIHKTTDVESSRCATMTMKALAGFKGKRIRGKAIGAKAFAVEGPGQVDAIVRDNKINTLFLSEGLGGMLQPVSRMAAEKGVLVLSCNEEYVRKGGAAIAVVRGKDNKPLILVNLTTAKAQGADLDARVLKMAEVIR